MTKCQVHDADDVVPGRICGRPMPCRDHGPRPTRYQTTTTRGRILRVTQDTVTAAKIKFLGACEKDEEIGEVVTCRDDFDVVPDVIDRRKAPGA